MTRAPERKRKPRFKVGQRVIIPEVSGMRFAGLPMQQDPRNVGKRGKIIGKEDVGGIWSPLIRLETGRIIHGYECWWRPLTARERGVRQ